MSRDKEVNLKQTVKMIGLIIFLFAALTIIFTADSYSKQGQQKIVWPSSLTTTAFSTFRPCAPTPRPPTDSDTPTATPMRPGIGTAPSPGPSVTPLPLSKVTDLAPELADRDKVYVYVMHCDGTFELFLADPKVPLEQEIPLLPDDIIYDWVPPASSMGHYPPPLYPPSDTNNP